MPGVFLPPPTLSPPLPSTNRVNKLISDCLDQNLGIAGTFSCLRQHSSVPGIVYPFFESTSFANFLRRIDGRDPIFAHSRALIDAGWLENPGEYETLFLNALDAVRPFQLPIATFTAQVAQIPNLPSAEHVLIGKYLSELKLPKLSTTRMIQLGHATRSTEDIPGLPNNWKDWLTNEFPVRLMNGLFGLPTTLPTFDRGARVQMQVPLQTFNANGDIVEARYNMNGLEAIDALIWESQIKPFFGTGDRLVMMTIVKDMLALETPADVAAWEERTLGMVDGAIAFLELMIFIPPSDTLLHLRNTRTLLHALHDFVPHEVVLTAAKITRAALPDKTTIDEKTAAFTLLHRIGLFSTLAKWMQTVNPVSKMIPGKPYLSTGAIQTLGTAFSDFLQITPGDAVRRLGWMNEISDGEFFASAMRMFVSSAREERAPSLKWTAKTLATLVVPIFDQIAQGNSTQRTSMQTFFAKIQPVIDQLAKKFSVPSAVLQSTGLFCQARMNDAGGLAGLSQADLVLRLSRPSGRDELVPWIQSGTLRALIEWSAQMNLHPILTPSPQ
ncbi:MAG: hypothetical protein JST16_10540 [Bdellovibrionales bacterium]|nr:hypothetical protein [Bdellovibrionales bacterium]